MGKWGEKTLLLGAPFHPIYNGFLGPPGRETSNPTNHQF